MKTNFKMKEAINKEEAIISILDVLDENPLWLNKCTRDLFAVVKQCWLLPMSVPSQDAFDLNDGILYALTKEQIINLFIEMKTEYYNFKDNTVWS